MKEYCEGSGTSDYEQRPYTGNQLLWKCAHCGRVLKSATNGKLRKHQVRGRTTASMDATMDSLWHHAGPPEGHPHFAIGLSVHIRDGARPAGWPEYEEFDDVSDLYDRRWQIQSVSDTGREPCTFEAAGWFWYPQDLTIA